jgi:hypothetical protein
MSTPETPASHVPPVPRYGEYANPAQGFPVQSQVSIPPQPAGQPGYYAQQPLGERPLRTADMIVSIILLVVGFFSVLYAIFSALSLNLQFDLIYEQYGITEPYVAGSASVVAQAIIIISHVILWALAVIFTTVLIRRRRISFWLPLSVGVLASIVFFIAIMIVVFADPNIIEYLSSQTP